MKITRSVFVSVTLLFFQFLFLQNHILAEDPTLGRLPDGRAFRTDREGNQLVDYIAELELEVESLKRQVRGLEDENADKQAALNRVSGGRDISPKVVEKDLVNPSPVLPECKPKIIEKVVERVVEKPVERIVEKPSACLPVAKADDNKEFVKEINGLKTQLAKANQELEQKTVDIDILNSKLENQKKLAFNQPAVSQPSMSPPLLPLATVKERPASRQGTDVRFKAVDMLRRTMLQDLRSFEDLVSHRNKLYSRVDKGKFPEPEKVMISELRQKLQNAEQVHDLSQVRTQISEQRGKVQQEIALYKRELKIR